MKLDFLERPRKKVITARQRRQDLGTGDYKLPSITIKLKSAQTADTISYCATVAYCFLISVSSAQIA